MISIDYRDRRPIYEQIIQKLEDLALLGLLKPDEQLPSVRQLAAELSINPNTIQRAYFELERRGVIYAVKGRGNFISDNGEEVRKQRVLELYTDLEALCERAHKLGISKEELLERCTVLFDQNRGGE